MESHSSSTVGCHDPAGDLNDTTENVEAKRSAPANGEFKDLMRHQEQEGGHTADKKDMKEEWLDETWEDVVDLAQGMSEKAELFSKNFTELTSWSTSENLIQRMLNLMVIELMLHLALELVWRFFNRRAVLRPSLFTNPFSTTSDQVSTYRALPSPRVLKPEGSAFCLKRTNPLLGPIGTTRTISFSFFHHRSQSFLLQTSTKQMFVLFGSRVWKKLARLL